MTGDASSSIINAAFAVSISKQTARAVFIFTGEETFLQTKKRGFSSEAAYVLGILTMALGTAMMA